jgi:hypothetical protein
MGCLFYSPILPLLLAYSQAVAATDYTSAEFVICFRNWAFSSAIKGKVK